MDNNKIIAIRAIMIEDGNHRSSQADLEMYLHFQQPAEKQGQPVQHLQHKANTNSMQSPQAILDMFIKYQPLSVSFPLASLHTSANLKLKRYRTSTYYGQFLAGKRQGLGIMLYSNQRIYQGQWQSDLKHGQGTQKFNNGCIYEGQYRDGKPDGVGRYLWKNGEVYDGEWKNGVKDGSGMWQGQKGDSYIGQWKAGKAEGYGVHTWVNGDRYEGQFKECLKHGQGIEKFANGDIYKGSYQNGKPSGFGQYYWANGSYFKGNFKNGLREGQGLWKKGPGNSDKFEGQYSNDKKCGYGIFTWASGNLFKGHYQSDQRHGFGQMYWNDGSFYKGMWSKGIQHGKGIPYLMLGEMYEPDQGIRKGLFEDNVLVSIDEEEYENRGFEAEQQIHTTINKINRPGFVKNLNWSNNLIEHNTLQSDIPQPHPPPSQKTTMFRTRAFSSKYRPNQLKSSQVQSYAYSDYQSVYSSDVPSNYSNNGNTPNKQGVQHQIIVNAHGKRFVKSKPKFLNNLKNMSYLHKNNKNSMDQNSRSEQNSKNTKGKIQHSSFYLHKLHKGRDNNHNQGQSNSNNKDSIVRFYEDKIIDNRNHYRNPNQNQTITHIQRINNNQGIQENINKQATGQSKHIKLIPRRHINSVHQHIRHPH